MIGGGAFLGKEKYNFAKKWTLGVEFLIIIVTMFHVVKH